MRTIWNNYPSPTHPTHHFSSLISGWPSQNTDLRSTLPGARSYARPLLSTPVASVGTYVGTRRQYLAALSMRTKLAPDSSGANNNCCVQEHTRDLAFTDITFFQLARCSLHVSVGGTVQRFMQSRKSLVGERETFIILF